MVKIRLLWLMKEIYLEFYYGSAKFISNISCDITKHKTMWKISESNGIHKVLKTYVMMFIDLMIMFMNLSLISQKFNSKNKFVFYKYTHNDEWDKLH
jgi:hypothetical protein